MKSSARPFIIQDYFNKKQLTPTKHPSRNNNQQISFQTTTPHLHTNHLILHNPNSSLSHLNYSKNGHHPPCLHIPPTSSKNKAFVPKLNLEAIHNNNKEEASQFSEPMTEKTRVLPTPNHSAHPLTIQSARDVTNPGSAYNCITPQSKNGKNGFVLPSVRNQRYKVAGRFQLKKKLSNNICETPSHLQTPYYPNTEQISSSKQGILIKPYAVNNNEEEYQTPSTLPTDSARTTNSPEEIKLKFEMPEQRETSPVEEKPYNILLNKPKNYKKILEEEFKLSADDNVNPFNPHNNSPANPYSINSIPSAGEQLSGSSSASASSPQNSLSPSNSNKRMAEYLNSYQSNISNSSKSQKRKEPNIIWNYFYPEKAESFSQEFNIKLIEVRTSSTCMDSSRHSRGLRRSNTVGKNDAIFGRFSVPVKPKNVLKVEMKWKDEDPFTHAKSNLTPLTDDQLKEYDSPLKEIKKEQIKVELKLERKCSQNSNRSYQKLSKQNSFDKYGDFTERTQFSEYNEDELNEIGQYELSNENDSLNGFSSESTSVKEITPFSESVIGLSSKSPIVEPFVYHPNKKTVCISSSNKKSFRRSSFIIDQDALMKQKIRHRHANSVVQFQSPDIDKKMSNGKKPHHKRYGSQFLEESSKALKFPIQEELEEDNHIYVDLFQTQKMPYVDRLDKTLLDDILKIEHCNCFLIKNLVKWQNAVYMKTLLLKNQIEEDATMFSNWEVNYNSPFQDKLRQDLGRSDRTKYLTNSDLIMRKMEIVITYYCVSQSIEYQQGMIDVLYPIILLHSPYFGLPYVYAYFKGILFNYLPNILHSKIVTKGKGLPHVKANLKLCEVLLKYHDKELYNYLTENFIFIEIFATSWVMTLLSRVCSLEILYEVWDIILVERDQLLLYYLVVAIIKFNKSKIMKNEDQSFAIQFLQKIKIRSFSELAQIYSIALELRSKTPKSFKSLVDRLKIFKQEDVFSNEQLKYMEDLMSSELLPVYSHDLQGHSHRPSNRIFTSDLESIIKKEECFLYLNDDSNVPYSEKEQYVTEINKINELKYSFNTNKYVLSSNVEWIIIYYKNNSFFKSLKGKGINFLKAPHSSNTKAIKEWIAKNSSALYSNHIMLWKPIKMDEISFPSLNTEKKILFNIIKMMGKYNYLSTLIMTKKSGSKKKGVKNI